MAEGDATAAPVLPSLVVPVGSRALAVQNFPVLARVRYGLYHPPAQYVSEYSLLAS